MKKYFYFLIFSLILLGVGTFHIYNKYFVFTGENEYKILKELHEKSEIIQNSAEKLEISPRLLASIIYTEKRINITLVDSYEDIYAYLGANSSIGLAQIRLNTGKWIIDSVKDSTSDYYIEKRYHHWLPVYPGRSDLIRLLKQDTPNCILAAFHIKQIIRRWQKDGYDISQRPDIVVTLYTYGLTDRETGKEITPHENPKSNFLGTIAINFYKSSKLQNEFPF